ncbi:hypothetical protein C7M84_008814 [Penaeus vannamei]|uniref:Uncharacterized protein n=1 Tax=Penaeus vannamei TaxID=6689 RepID=A0A423T8J7_PENVA|nr:hypothetical protein C7M84_008814 [Penaeus vannamei]
MFTPLLSPPLLSFILFSVLYRLPFHPFPLSPYFLSINLLSLSSSVLPLLPSSPSLQPSSSSFLFLFLNQSLFILPLSFSSPLPFLPSPIFSFLPLFPYFFFPSPHSLPFSSSSPFLISTNLFLFLSSLLPFPSSSLPPLPFSSPSLLSSLFLPLPPLPPFLPSLPLLPFPITLTCFRECLMVATIHSPVATPHPPHPPRSQPPVISVSSWRTAPFLRPPLPPPPSLPPPSPPLSAYPPLPPTSTPHPPIRPHKLDFISSLCFHLLRYFPLDTRHFTSPDPFHTSVPRPIFLCCPLHLQYFLLHILFHVYHLLYTTPSSPILHLIISFIHLALSQTFLLPQSHIISNIAPLFTSKISCKHPTSSPTLPSISPPKSLSNIIFLLLSFIHPTSSPTFLPQIPLHLQHLHFTSYISPSHPVLPPASFSSNSTLTPTPPHPPHTLTSLPTGYSTPTHSLPPTSPTFTFPAPPTPPLPRPPPHSTHSPPHNYSTLSSPHPPPRPRKKPAPFAHVPIYTLSNPLPTRPHAHAGRQRVTRRKDVGQARELPFAFIFSVTFV